MEGGKTPLEVWKAFNDRRRGAPHLRPSAPVIRKKTRKRKEKKRKRVIPASSSRRLIRALNLFLVGCLLLFYFLTQRKKKKAQVSADHLSLRYFLQAGASEAAAETAGSAGAKVSAEYLRVCDGAHH